MEESKKQSVEKEVSKSKKPHISAEEWISRMKIAFANAKSEGIFPQLQTLGYTEEKLNGFLEQIATIESLSQQQKSNYAKQYAETEKVDKKRKEIQEVYMRHLGLCRILFKGNVLAGKSLGLVGERKSAYGVWFQQVSSFYSQILATPEFLEKVGTINIKEKDLKDQQDALAELSNLKENQKREMAEAQKATEARDNAFDSLYPHYSELVSYAKILFQNSQALEALGIVVKR